MSAESGLSPHPWVSIAVSDGEVSVDGVPLPTTGTLEDRYLVALQHVASQVAAPLGRQVGVTVRDGAGVVTHLAISPEGQATAIEDLVRDSASPPGLADSMAVAAEAAREEPAATPRRRRLWWAAAAVLAVVGGLVAASAFSAADDGSDPTSAESPQSSPSTPTATVTTRAVVTKWRTPRGGLVGAAASPRKGVLRLQLGATRTPVRVVVRITTSTGDTIEKALTLRPGLRTLQLTGLPGGSASWSATAPRMRPLSGSVRVRGPLPSPLGQPSVAPSPSGQGGGGGKPHRHPTGPGEVPPTAPIDPDDL